VLNARRSTSLRVRLMFFTAVLAVLFMLALLAAVRGAFLIALEQSVEKRLASEANALISVARLDDGRLSMPEKLPDEKLNTLEAKLLGFIYDREGNLVWQSRSSLDESVEYRPQFNGQGHVFEQGRRQRIFHL
jgi:two-component system sensor histidine kinase PhoQ